MLLLVALLAAVTACVHPSPPVELRLPTLYDGSDGGRRAAELGASLVAARAELEAALAEWAEATETVEAMA